MAKNKLKLALVQMFSEKGDISQNLADTARQIEAAEERGIDIIGFPEAGITGYIDPKRYPEAVISLDGPEVAEFVRMTEGRNITVLHGLIEYNPDGLPFTTQVVARNGKITGIHHKMYDLDVDELGVEPWYTLGNEIRVFDHDGVIFGIAICADLVVERLFEGCAELGAQVVFELAAPGLYGDQATRNWKSGYEWWEGVCNERFAAYAKKHNLWIPVATQAGRTSDEDFPGGGYLFNPQGERVFATNTWEPCTVYLEIDFATGEVREIE